MLWLVAVVAAVNLAALAIARVLARAAAATLMALVAVAIGRRKPERPATAVDPAA
jgi:hypothetical protein